MTQPPKHFSKPSHSLFWSCSSLHFEHPGTSMTMVVLPDVSSLRMVCWWVRQRSVWHSRHFETAIRLQPFSLHFSGWSPAEGITGACFGTSWVLSHFGGPGAAEGITGVCFGTSRVLHFGGPSAAEGTTGVCCGTSRVSHFGGPSAAEGITRVPAERVTRVCFVHLLDAFLGKLSFKRNLCQLSSPISFMSSSFINFTSSTVS